MKRFLDIVIPKDMNFFRLLTDQVTVVKEGMDLFSKFIESYDKLDSVGRKKFVKKIKEIEKEGDLITHEIIEAIHKSFVTPIDREDIHQLAVLLDDLIDLIYDVAYFIEVYKIDKLPPAIIKLTEIGSEMVGEVDKAISSMNNLSRASKLCINLHEVENKGDDIYTSSMADLFNKANDALYIMKVKDLYDKLENFLDKGENIANIIENIVVKHA